MAEPVLIAQTPHLQIRAEFDKEILVVRIEGWINEDINFGKLLESIKDYGPKGVVFDLGRVSELNSCGVREWLLFLERMPVTMSYGFLVVGEIVIEQANIVPGMLGRAGTPVLAFHAPYFCATCKQRFLKVLKTSDIDISGDGFAAPAFRCEKCSTGLEFDAIEQEYFQFLVHSRNRR